MDIDFSGKTALVTGAGKGIGREIAKALLQGGAKTFALSRTKEDLETLKEEFPSINTICVDLADWDASRKAVVDIGPVDLLVNNAAIVIIKDFFSFTSEDFDDSFNINVKSILNISQVVTKGMVERGKGGSIVNISSQASKIALDGHAIYTSTKAAIEGMTRVMALELGPHQIRTNCVNPTVVLTKLGKKVWPEDADHTKALLRRIPQHKFAEVKDVVNAVIYLLSDKSDMINGAFLPVDGGAWIS